MKVSDSGSPQLSEESHSSSFNSHASRMSQVSRASKFVKVSAKRMSKALVDDAASGGLYELPNRVVLELPSAAWLTRKTRDLAWSRRSALPSVLLAFTLLGSARVACSALPGPVLGFSGKRSESWAPMRRAALRTLVARS